MVWYYMARPWTCIWGIALVICASFLYVNFTAMHEREQPFNAVQWRSLSHEARLNDPGCVRGGMALFLSNNHSLGGLPQASVMELLGEADTVLLNQLHFRLGQCHWDWRHSSLVVTLEEGRVSQLSIVYPASDF
ncbi:hypothetical protein SAMN05216588_101111 [Pseudomonas flavescens]|uniref:Uncharacterized protein n=1 Tax=Phytopseudomonas flavescens TaxID=29435 RepID=A0A1G7XG29_9GAMM|nr:hypothetical protein [Pseudomonas flavescens]SDG83172.1 hypothetical protein SAMN05216588_101111 [Pseudomonas flavescens]